MYIHGLWLGGGESILLRGRLSDALGAQCRVFSYSSVSVSVDENAEALGEYLHQIKADTLHLVAHSLGGLVTLALFEREHAAFPPGRVVLLGSPVRGSRSAARLVQLPFGGALLGRAAAGLLLDGPDRRWGGARELGVIAGNLDLGLGRLLGSMEGASDGTVFVDETTLPGAAEQILMHVTHTGMVYSAEVATQVAAFLRDGRFAPVQ